MLQALLRFIEGDGSRVKPRAAAEPAAPSWSLDMPLLQFGTLDERKRPLAIPWALRDACEGCQIFGGTGSGKTSGPGAAVARALLRAGCGGLVLCAKPDEAENWYHHAKAADRLDDLLLFSPESPERFNFLDYELNRPGRGGGIVENAVSVLLQCAEIAGGMRNGEDDIWEKAMKQLLRNCVELCRLAREPVRMRTLYKLSTDAEHAEKMLTLAEALVGTGSEREDLEVVSDYFRKEWATLPDRAKGSVQMTFSSVCDPFFRGALRDLFTKETTVTPEDAFAGKIIVVDLPLKEFNELGRFAAVIWKHLFQRAAERRKATDASRPLFIYADESQFFLTSGDADFQTTARSSRTATIYLTQNLPNYYSVVGGRNGKSKVDSFLGNMQTKLFCQNADKDTNTWAAETIARVFQQRQSRNHNVNFGGTGGQGSAGVSSNEVLDFDLQPRAFLELAKGGPPFNHVVTSVLFQGGRMFPTGKVYAPVAFNQQQT